MHWCSDAKDFDCQPYNEIDIAWMILPSFLHRNAAVESLQMGIPLRIVPCAERLATLK
jgi:hypothetical protein